MNGYVIQRNGWYMLARSRNEPKPIVARADTPIPCIWGEHKRDAMIFSDEVIARKIANQVRGEVEKA